MGQIGKGLEGIKLSVFRFHVLHHQKLVLNADAHKALFINSRLIGDGHARLEGHMVGHPEALGAFVGWGPQAHAVAGAAAVVQTVLPDLGAGHDIQVGTGAALHKDSPAMPMLAFNT